MNLPMTMSLQTVSFEEFITTIAAALGCGLLVGLERERSKLKHEYKTFAGFRSFAISSLLGAICFFIWYRNWDCRRSTYRRDQYRIS